MARLAYSPNQQPVRARIAASLIAAVSFLSLVYSFGSLRQAIIISDSSPADSISAFENRLRPLQADLAPFQSAGFVEPGRPSRTADPTDLARFLLSQYALAPLIIVPGTDATVIIEIGADGAPLPPGSVLIAGNRFGDRVYLREVPANP